MSGSQMQELEALEGRRVGVAVRGGDRLDDCQLMSAGRRGPVLWVVANGVDTFVPVGDVLDVWEAA
jgi:hypothetical protein